MVSYIKELQINASKDNKINDEVRGNEVCQNNEANKGKDGEEIKSSGNHRG